jgi:hypothetical protein
MITNPHTRKWHEANHERLIENNKRFRKRRAQWLQELKESLSCIKCGESRWWILDFHHRNPQEKEMNMASFMHHFGMKRILEEIEKCDVLCANCHRDEHFQLKGGFRTSA